jgi:hypothetical protein
MNLEGPKKGDWLRCAKHPKGRQATVPVPFFRASQPGFAAPIRCLWRGPVRCPPVRKRSPNGAIIYEQQP